MRSLALLAIVFALLCVPIGGLVGGCSDNQVRARQVNMDSNNAANNDADNGFHDGSQYGSDMPN